MPNYRQKKKKNNNKNRQKNQQQQQQQQQQQNSKSNKTQSPNQRQQEEKKEVEQRRQQQEQQQLQQASSSNQSRQSNGNKGQQKQKSQSRSGESRRQQELQSPTAQPTTNSPTPSSTPTLEAKDKSPLQNTKTKDKSQLKNNNSHNNANSQEDAQQKVAATGHDVVASNNNNNTLTAVTVDEAHANAANCDKCHTLNSSTANKTQANKSHQQDHQQDHQEDHQQDHLQDHQKEHQQDHLQDHHNYNHQQQQTDQQISRQQFAKIDAAATAVASEECKRTEDANVEAHQTKRLDNTTVATSNGHSEQRHGVSGGEGFDEVELLESDAQTSKEKEASTTMGNKDSKTINKSATDDGDAKAPVTTLTNTHTYDTISQDRNKAGANVVEELEVTPPKTQIAKVIVHRIITQTENVENKRQQKAERDIDKDDVERKEAEHGGAMQVEELKEEKKEKVNVTAQQNKRKVKQEQRKKRVKAEEIEEAQKMQQTKVIVHKIEQEAQDGLALEQTTRNADESLEEQQAVDKSKQAKQSSPESKVNKIAESSSEHAAEYTNLRRTEPTSNGNMFTEPKVIIHQIELESTSTSTSPTPAHYYQVELADAESPTSQLSAKPKQSILNKSIVHIQELSDGGSSSECNNDNPPVISEAESETESTAGAGAGAGACDIDYAQLIRTLSPETEEEDGEAEEEEVEEDNDKEEEEFAENAAHGKSASAQSNEEQQYELKQRRAQKRVALETHFLPQMLSPRYLDSILEENSDMSDARSDCSENPLMQTHSGDDLRGGGGGGAAKVRKAIEVLPRSNLDLTRRHATTVKKPLGALPKKPLAQQREQPVAMVVAAKIIDGATATQAQQTCTRLASEHKPESEAAEVIYLSSSTSSSLSDLLELDAETEAGEGNDEAGDSSRSTIDLDTDAHEMITKPGSADGKCGVAEESGIRMETANVVDAAADSRESTPVNQAVVAGMLSEAQNEMQKMLTIKQNNVEGEQNAHEMEELAAANAPGAAAAADIGTNVDDNADAGAPSPTTANINTEHIESEIFENLKSLQMLATPNQERALLSNGKNEVAAAAATKTNALNASESEASEIENELGSDTTTITTNTTARCEFSQNTSDTDDTTITNNSSSGGGGGSSSGSNGSTSDISSAATSIIGNIAEQFPSVGTFSTSDSLNVDPAVLLETIELEMNNVREILNSHLTDANINGGDLTLTGGGSQAMTTTYSKYDGARASVINQENNNFSAMKNSSPSPPPIPPPPPRRTSTHSTNASDYSSDFIGTQSYDSHANSQQFSTTHCESSAPPPTVATRHAAPHEIIHTVHLNANGTAPDLSATAMATSPSNSIASLKSALSSLSSLGRQESTESHCSDSTQHSQCTAINVGSRPQTDHELTPPPPPPQPRPRASLITNSLLSDASNQREEHSTYQHSDWSNAQLSNHTLSSLEQQGATARSQKDPPIKKLRLLCTETLASMPYGEQVLEELASVAQNISELQAAAKAHLTSEHSFVDGPHASSSKSRNHNMPYPLPELPHISELQLSIGSAASDRSQISSTQQRTSSSNANTSTTTHIVPIKLLDINDSERPKNLHSTTATSAPPVPTPPAHYRVIDDSSIGGGGGGSERRADASWLGVPTAADPNVLVCLSPAQQQQYASKNSTHNITGAVDHHQHKRQQQEQQQQPDQLLDAHQKFLERRGYHEYSEEQVQALNANNLQKEEEQILKMTAYMKKLRKSLSPSPPPVPPPPVPSKSYETAAKAHQQAEARRTAANGANNNISPIGVYDDATTTATTYYRNINEQEQQQEKKQQTQRERTVTFANGEDRHDRHDQHEQHEQQQQQSQQIRLQTLIQNMGKPADFNTINVARGSSSSFGEQQPTSSHENNSRQTCMSGAAAEQADASTAFEGNQPAHSATASQFAKENPYDTTASSSGRASYNLHETENQKADSTSTSTISTSNGKSNSIFFPSSSTTGKMQSVESELAKMFPSMGASNIFDSERKRFSNIESSTAASSGSSGNCYSAQLQSTLPKRYSNIETHSYEAKKRMENGQVVFDYNDKRHERHSEGDKSLESASTPSALPSHFPVREAHSAKGTLHYPVSGAASGDGNSEIMSATKLNATTTTTNEAKTATTATNAPEPKSETKDLANKNENEMPKSRAINMTNFSYSGVPNHNNSNASANTTSTSTTIKEEQQQQHIKKSKEEMASGSGGALPPTFSSAIGHNSAFEEFRQRAKADAEAFTSAFGETPATAPPRVGPSADVKHSAFNFQQEKLFKDFDTLSQQLNSELEQGKTQREQREKSASHYDLSRSQWNFKDHFEQLKKQRHEHMQELEREIERSVRSRQLKSWANGRATPDPTSAPGRTYDIPIRIEQQQQQQQQRASGNVNAQNGYASATSDGGPAQPRAYNIPIVLENGAPAAQTSQTQYDTLDDASRFRRAESMFNLTENNATHTRQQRPYTGAATTTAYERPKSTAADDWARYASDFGSSENIVKPFAREVEICYQRQRPRTIRAPRLSISTNDLSSSNTHTYDSYNAYNVRRTHAPMLSPLSPSQQQQQKPHHASCYSVLERDPNPTYISTTTRRGVSPAPQQTYAATRQEPPPYAPVAPERQRRASLPREIQEQQLKYISSKEEELRMEFERLQNERRRVMEELNNTPQTTPTTPTTPTLQMPQHTMRDIYRPMPKLPTLTEDEVFRQQMAEEWLSKVAEREERRLHKIIKISKVNEDHQHHQQQGGHQHQGNAPHAPPRHIKPDISDEFLKRVQERRAKMGMPADSDWESGAESQPVGGAGHASESDAEGGVPVKVTDGKSEADLRQLPRHLREFARLSQHNEEKIDGGHRVVHEEEERRHEANANSMSSALKKSSMVKTVKIARQPEIVGREGQQSQSSHHRVPISVQQQQQQHQQYPAQQGQSRRFSSGGEQVNAAETAPFTTKPPPKPTSPLSPKTQHHQHSPLLTKLPVTASFEEMFATSPFKSRIYDEFEKYWRNFDQTT